MASASDLGKREGRGVRVKTWPRARTGWGAGRWGSRLRRRGSAHPSRGLWPCHSRAAGPLRRPQEARGQHEGWQAGLPLRT